MLRVISFGSILGFLLVVAGSRTTAETLPMTPRGQGPGIGAAERVLPPTLRNTVEFRFKVDKVYDNPCDPDQIAVDALVTGTDKRTVTVPAFWYEPYTHKVETRPLDLSAIRLLRFFITAGDFGEKASLSFALDDIEVFDSKTGARKLIEDFEGDLRWTAAKEVTLQKIAGEANGGSSALLVRIDTDEKSSWPGLNLQLPPDDWSPYDSLRFQFRPIAGLSWESVGVEFYNKANDKFQSQAYQGEATVMKPTWRERVWTFATPPMPKTTWAAQGVGSWRLRLAVPSSGGYTVQLRGRDAGGETVAAPLTAQLTPMEPDGFIRTDPAGKRYFRFDSGKPYLAIGRAVCHDIWDFSARVLATGGRTATRHHALR